MRCGLGIAIVLGLAHVGVLRAKSGQETRAVELQERYSLLQEEVRLAENLIREWDQLAHRRVAVGVIQEGHPVASLLELTGEALPDPAYLTFFRFQRGHSGRADTPQEKTQKTRLVLRGQAPGHPEVGDIIRQLSETGPFSSVRLVSVTDGPSPSDGARFGFELDCTVRERWEDG
jgi:hypothetical protein